MEIQPVILCGGAGSRLWPLSRRAHRFRMTAVCCKIPWRGFMGCLL
ncbi:MAG: sugar phosphate nucleotidyltransferase [Pseudomonadales bacterium]